MAGMGGILAIGVALATPAGSALAAAVAHPFLPVTPAPVEITDENADLDGAGALEFKPDIRDFHANPPPGGEGSSLTVRLVIDPASGQPASCDIGQSEWPDLAKVGCAQLMKSARFRLFPGYDLSVKHGILDVQFNFFMDPPHGPPGPAVFAYNYPAYVNTVIHYPASAHPADQRLGAADGKFAVTGLVGFDYPVMALRYGMESTSTVEMGIDRTGKVVTCRPFGSNPVSRTAFLDNYTCWLMLRRGHFDFAAGASDYAGLKYLTQALVWRIPR